LLIIHELNERYLTNEWHWLWKETYRNKDGAALSQPRRSYYLYADEGLIAESQQAITPPLPVGEGWGEGQATTEPTITTQYGPRPDSPFGTAVLFVKAKDSAGGNTVAYYHHDHLGTPIYATDRAGLVVWSAQYNAFGSATVTTPTPAEGKPTIESNLRFPGQVEDAETGLYYNWHRYYDPELGRYVTADPIGLVGGMNLYAYVGGDPVNLRDSSGEIIQFVMLCVRSSVCRGAVVAAALWVWNAYDTANDIADAAEEINNPCATGADKAAAIGWLVVGMIDPTPGNLGKKGIKKSKELVDLTSPKFVDLTTPKRRKHILDGEPNGGGGHRAGTGRGKSEFPKEWSDDKIIDAISDVATDPNSVSSIGRGGKTVVEGIRDGIKIRVVISKDGEIVTGYPIYK
jgi:RHS repeat-associated protein